MSSRHSWVAIGLIVASATLVVTVALTRLGAAAARTSAAVRAADRISQDAAALEQLRGAQQTVGAGAEPQADALPLIIAALADAKLRATHLQSLGEDVTSATPRASAVAGRDGLVRRSLRLILAEISLPELGCFLRSWQATQAVWTVDQVGLQRGRASSGAGPARWTVSLRLSASYWAEPDRQGDRP